VEASYVVIFGDGNSTSAALTGGVFFVVP
jgi:hypothetical protein